MNLRLIPVLVLALPSLVIAQGSLRAQVETYDKAVVTAMKKRDFAKLEKVLQQGMAKDFTYVEAGKTSNFKQMFANMKMGLGMFTEITSCTATILSVKESGNTGKVVEKQVVVGKMVGEDKKVHVFEFAGKSYDTYRKENGKWKLVKMESKENTMKMDGKAIPMAGPAAQSR